jgi:hypothetical protein
MQHSEAVKSRKRRLAACGVVILTVTLLMLPGLPWSGRIRYAIKRLTARIETRIAYWRGQHPRTVSLSGRLSGSGAFVEAVRGARVAALESDSGYAAMSDAEGRFVLPHLTWYPDATFTLFINVNHYDARVTRVRVPSTSPEDGVIDLGSLSLDLAAETDPAEAPQRYLRYDRQNRDYYIELFHRLTATKKTDHSKLEAITSYVSTRHNPEQRALSFRSSHRHAGIQAHSCRRGSLLRIRMASLRSDLWSLLPECEWRSRQP